MVNRKPSRRNNDITDNNHHQDLLDIYFKNRSSSPLIISDSYSANKVWYSRDEVFDQPRSVIYNLFTSTTCGIS